MDSICLSMEKFFTQLEQISSDDNMIKSSTCCDDIKNHRLYQGTTLCSECHNTITNIIEGPEWRFYGSNDTKSSDPTRCGMPVNGLLPESSVGTSISYRRSNYNMNKYD